MIPPYGLRNIVTLSLELVAIERTTSGVDYLSFDSPIGFGDPHGLVRRDFALGGKRLK
jgi:hypothetical protein